MTTDTFSINFPDNLPICTQRLAVENAINTHQVVIVCGETGSGKTTQLPKIALAMGRGAQGKRIGHTQPRRIAASSVAKRIAEELKTPLGEIVGFKVRFHDRVSGSTRIKLMTDGILLAETQTDPLLKAYDTLIIDEAHERSLNIDFLLGYLKEILPRRPDLKVIVTSATIDAERFAKHFSSAKGQAPVLMVSGRMYPVEVRYAPFEESRDFDISDAIVDAVESLWVSAHTNGDILVFLPGEREIRECGERLHGYTTNKPALRGCEILPLFARLSQADQERIFSPHYSRRIVLTTNVAETSLTVPNIRYVIDTGLARIKRYSFRNKVEQLLVESISQAAANQRKGRCGRLAEGICVRFYSEIDFNGRPAFTDPEILRSSLAGVILRMKSLHLGRVEDFPFLEAPMGRAISDGYQLLQELGVVDETNELTPMGHDLAKLPLDPRVSRMLIAGRENGALSEILVIASALCIQDVRDRPMNDSAAADKAHGKFDDDKSEFSGLLRLWAWFFESKGEAIPHRPKMASQESDSPHKLSNKKHETLLRENFISIRRFREWREIYNQLYKVVAEHKWILNQTPATYEALHQSILSGLLGNVGCKLDESQSGEYLGARSIKFSVHPGAHLRKKTSRWVMAAELVETSKLYARCVANIEPQWLERIGSHLIKKQLIDPHWSKKSGEVMALERATLYGMVIYSGRRVAYGKIDPSGAREIFIRSALAGDDIESSLPFIAHNRKLIWQVQEIEHKSRRQDVLVDDELIFHFYDQHIPADVCSVYTLERWYRNTSKTQSNLLFLLRDELMRHEAAGITTQAFPKYIRLGGIDCQAQYLHEPGDASDGLTVTIPLYVLNQIHDDRADWLVSGMLKDRVLAMLKTLHQRVRSRLVPLPATAEKYAEHLSKDGVFSHGSLIDAILKLLRDSTGMSLTKADFRIDALQAHHFMNFCLVDEHGRYLTRGRNLPEIKSRFGQQARGAFQALAEINQSSIASKVEIIDEKKVATKEINSPQKKEVDASTYTAKTYTSWSFGELPELMELKKGDQILVGFPALIDHGECVAIEVFDEPETAMRKHFQGLHRLIAIQIKDVLKYLEKNIPDLTKMSLIYTQVGNLDGGKSSGGSMEALRDMIVDLTMHRAFLMSPLPHDENSFNDRVKEGRVRLTLIANEVAKQTHTVLQEYAKTIKKIKESKGHSDCVADIKSQISKLVTKDFLTQISWQQLQHVPRYLKAIQMRLDKVKQDATRDAHRQKELQSVELRYWRRISELKGHVDNRMQEYRWLLEELRVSLFAQELRTPQPVSVKRLDKAWEKVLL